MFRKSVSLLALAFLFGPAQAAEPLVAHEWGLWHLMGGDAQTMGQVFETLPPHVNNSIVDMNDFGWPNFGTLPDGTVVKKPVVWFYGPEGSAVEYKLTPRDQGNVLANFPSVSDSEFNVSATWKLTLGAKGFPEPEGEKGVSPWYGKLYLPDANSVSVPEKNETEGFLFYEASTFSGLPVALSENGFVVFTETMPLVVSISKDDAGLAVQFDNALPATIQWQFPAAAEKMDTAQAADKLTQQLVRFGLFEPEAKAFVSVWQPELFETNGRCVLAVLAPETYARLLPAQITPAPQSFVRVGAILVDLP